MFPAQEHIYRVAPHAEAAASELRLGAVVEPLDEPVEQSRKAPRLAPAHLDRLGVEVVGVAYAVEAGHRRNHHDIPPARQQGAGGTQAQFLYLVVDAEVLLDIGVARGDVCLGLVIVIVGHEVLHGIVWEERLELAVELCRKGLVVAEYQRRTLQAFDDVGHSERLAGACHAEQRDVAHPLVEGPAQLPYGLRLVSGGAVVRFKLELHRGKYSNITPIRHPSRNYILPGRIADNPIFMYF